MTGGALARKIKEDGKRLDAHYDPVSRQVFLPEEIANGADAWSLFVAAHESHHARQHERWPFLFAIRWIQPVTWFLEYHASREALRSIAPLVTPARLSECRGKAIRLGLTYL